MLTRKAHISQNLHTLQDEGERKSTDRRKKEMKKCLTYFDLHALIDRRDRIICVIFHVTQMLETLKINVQQDNGSVITDL